MKNLFFGFPLFLILLTYGCNCGFFSGCPPSSDDLIKEYFIEAAMKPGCKIEYSWVGGRDGYQVFGVLFCPVNIRNGIIQTAQPWDGCFIDTEYGDDIQNLDCGLFDFKNLFDRSNYTRSDHPEWFPSTYQGIWTVYDVVAEPPKDNDHFHNCTLYYQENSGNLYFLVAKGRYP